MVVSSASALAPVTSDVLVEMDGTAIMVATIGALGLVTQGLITRKHVKRVQGSLGEANGRGPAIKMLTDLQDDVNESVKESVSGSESVRESESVSEWVSASP